MNKFINKCPACGGDLKITSLSCSKCSLELRGDFPVSPFERLDDSQYEFLFMFLKNRGNLKNIQEEKGLSYQAVKRELDELLISLGIEEKQEYGGNEMLGWRTDSESTKASEIIKTKLKECGGRAVIYTARGLSCEICVSPDKKHIISNKLPISSPYRFEVFDLIVELLLKSSGKAPKGNGRNFKLGEPGCDESTVVGYIGKYYSGKRNGESVFDPVFVFASVLEWAGIAHNGRGELVLTAEYKNRIAK